MRTLTVFFLSLCTVTLGGRVAQAADSNKICKGSYQVQSYTGLLAMQIQGNAIQRWRIRGA